MQLLISLEELKKYGTDALIPFKCKQCGLVFYRSKQYVNRALNPNTNITADFCSNKCLGVHNGGSSIVSCKNCGKEFRKSNAQIKATKNNFCCKSCAATYNNKHKTFGTRRSKLERWLEVKLKDSYPDLEILYNSKKAIGSELDIYIPSFKLAFELNGIYHYEPIHGKELLSSIQSNDTNKFQACQIKGISLCIIDVSKQVYVKENTCIPYLKIIVDIIQNHLHVLPERDLNSQ